jgi:predicted acetyltransferase
LLTSFGLVSSQIKKAEKGIDMQREAKRGHERHEQKSWKFDIGKKNLLHFLKHIHNYLKAHQSTMKNKAKRESLRSKRK